MSNEIEVAGRKIGYGHPAFIVAELGLNHNGDLETALEMVDAAAECGVDGVKVQNYRTGDFVKSKDEIYEYRTYFEMENGSTILLDENAETAWEMFQFRELCFDDLKDIRDRCCKNGVVFHSTPSGISGVEDLIEIGARHILKISSDAVLDSVMISEGRENFDAVVISLGMYETYERVRCIYLHCVREYPTPDHKANLGRISKIKIGHRFVGYSDHTRGTKYAVSSVLDYGACYLECHFTLNHKSYGPDHIWSKDPKEMKEIVDCIHSAGL